MHSSFGFGDGKTGGKQVLEYAESVDLVDPLFQKRSSYLVPYCSNDNQTQVDNILTKKSQRSLVNEFKVILGEEFVTQDKLLICATKIRFPAITNWSFLPKLRLRKLKDVTSTISTSSRNNSVESI